MVEATGEVVFDKQGSSTFCQGENVQGVATLSISQDMDGISNVRLTLSRIEETRWDVTQEGIPKMKTFQDSHEFLVGTIPLSLDSTSLTAGSHRLPFCFQLPDNIAPSFQYEERSGRCSVCYQLGMAADWSDGQTLTITCAAPLQIESRRGSHHSSSEPKHIKQETSAPSCLCFSGTDMQAEACLSHEHVVFDEPVTVRLGITLSSKQKITADAAKVMTRIYAKAKGAGEPRMFDIPAIVCAPQERTDTATSKSRIFEFQFQPARYPTFQCKLIKVECKVLLYVGGTSWAAKGAHIRITHDLHMYQSGQNAATVATDTEPQIQVVDEVALGSAPGRSLTHSPLLLAPEEDIAW